MPVIYAWNEALGIGNHVAYFKYGKSGCYECLFKRDEDNEELYGRTSYCEHGQDVVQKVAGCGSAFIPAWFKHFQLKQQPCVLIL